MYLFNIFINCDWSRLEFIRIGVINNHDYKLIHWKYRVNFHPEILIDEPLRDIYN